MRIFKGEFSLLDIIQNYLGRLDVHQIVFLLCVLKHRHYIWEPRSDFAFKRDGTSIKDMLNSCFFLSVDFETHTTKPSSMHPSISSGTGFPLSSDMRSMFIAHSMIAISMNKELFATCRPTQMRRPNPYVT